jgi:hypothetical protein
MGIMMARRRMSAQEKSDDLLKREETQKLRYDRRMEDKKALAKKEEAMRLARQEERSEAHKKDREHALANIRHSTEKSQRLELEKRKLEKQAPSESMKATKKAMSDEKKRREEAKKSVAKEAKKLEDKPAKKK